MNFRIVLIVLNILVLAGLVVYVAISVGRSPEPKDPENLTPFLDDDALEGRRLDRVLGWALLFAAVIAIALPVYWLREPDRQEESIGYFDDGAVERGAVLFANSASEATRCGSVCARRSATPPPYEWPTSWKRSPGRSRCETRANTRRTSVASVKSS